MQRHFRTWHCEEKPIVLEASTVWEILSKKIISLKHGNEIFQEIRKILGRKYFPRHLRESLRELMFHFRNDFDGNFVTFKNSSGDLTSTLVFAKHLSDLAARTITEKKIKRPRIVFQCDGGQKKLLVTMIIYDLDDLDKNGEFQPGGRRGMYVVARAHYADENSHNWNLIFEKLKLWDFHYDFIISGDLKTMNLFTGRYLVSTTYSPAFLSKIFLEKILA